MRYVDNRRAKLWARQLGRSLAEVVIKVECNN